VKDAAYSMKVDRVGDERRPMFGLGRFKAPHQLKRFVWRRGGDLLKYLSQRLDKLGYLPGVGFWLRIAGVTSIMQ